MDKWVESQQIPNSGQMDCWVAMKVGRSAGLEELNAGLGAARGISPQGLCIAKKVEVCVCAAMTEAEAGSQRSPEPQRSQNKQVQFYTGHLRLLQHSPTATVTPAFLLPPLCLQMCLCVLQDLDPYTGCWSWPLSCSCSSLLMPHPLVEFWLYSSGPEGLGFSFLFLLPYGTWAAPRIRKFQPWRKCVQILTISDHFQGTTCCLFITYHIGVCHGVGTKCLAVAQVSKLSYRTITRFPHTLSSVERSL